MIIDSINSFLQPVDSTIQRFRRFIGYFFLPLSFLSFGFFFTKTGVKDSGAYSLYVLWVLLWIPIFARVLRIQIFQTILPLRKEIGILMGTLAFVHGAAYVVKTPTTLLMNKAMWISHGFLSYLAFGVIALTLTIPLVLTSNDWAMKKLGRKWKMLHRTVYAIIILTVIHVVLLKWFLHFEYIPVVILVLYFIGKGLEWGGIHLKTIESEKSYPKGQKWLCVPCGYIYDPAIGDVDSGILAGTEFSDIPDTWTCPLCGVKKGDFVPYTEGAPQIELPTHDGIVTEMTYLNPTTVELVVEVQDDLSSLPGQFATFLWEDAEGSFKRSYSIGRQDGKKFLFLIKLSDLGRGARVIKTLIPGAKIRISGVYGSFLLQNTVNPKIFISTGTGLAPIYNMLIHMGNTPCQKTLYFSVATKADLFYSEILRSIPNLNLYICTTREDVEGCYHGRVDASLIDTPPETEWYLCGNPKMVSETKEKLKVKGFTHVYSEEF